MRLRPIVRDLECHPKMCIYVIKYLLCTCCVPDTLLDTKHIMMNMTDQVPMPQRDILMESLRSALQRKTKAEHSDICCSNIFSDLSPRVMETKITKWELIKLKTFAEQRKPQTKQKDNLQNGTNYLQIFATDKGLISKNIQTIHMTQYQKQTTQ